MVHDLGILIALLPVADYPPGGFDWAELNPFATVRRYEDGALPISAEEIEFRGLISITATKDKPSEYKVGTARSSPPFSAG